MNIELFRHHCISKKGVTEEFPFDNQTLAFKVGSKIFTLTNVELFTSINLKCDPEEAMALREKYAGVLPGYHMNKKHWNTIVVDGSIPDKLIFGWIDDSYQLVINSLSKKQQSNIS